MDPISDGPMQLWAAFEHTEMLGFRISPGA
jgi:hypothetical protein